MTKISKNKLISIDRCKNLISQVIKTLVAQSAKLSHSKVII